MPEKVFRDPELLLKPLSSNTAVGKSPTGENIQAKTFVGVDNYLRDPVKLVGRLRV